MGGGGDGERERVSYLYEMERERVTYLYEMERGLLISMRWGERELLISMRWRERELLIYLPSLSSEILRESSRVYLTRLIDVLSQPVSFVSSKQIDIASRDYLFSIVLQWISDKKVGSLSFVFNYSNR